MIETKRLNLRRFTPADLDWLAQVTAEPKTRGFLWDGPTDRDTTARNLERWMEEYERGLGHLAMIHKPDETPIGHCGLTEDEDSGRILLSYALREDYWCMGLAPEACRAVLRYGFEELGLEEVWTATCVENRPEPLLGRLQEEVRRQARLPGPQLAHPRGLNPSADKKNPSGGRRGLRRRVTSVQMSFPQIKGILV